MPEMSYEPHSYSDKSALTEGWKPAYLLAITDEATPETWKMYAQSPRLWRWHFACWEVPTLIDRQAPEHQSAPSSQKFTPKGKQPSSKAYAWTSALLNRPILAGERVNLDPLMPLPCRVKVSRNGEYANIMDVEAWPEGMQYLTDPIKQGLHGLMHGNGQPPAPQPPPPVQPPQYAQPAQATQPPGPAPGMQTWQTTGQQQPAPTTKQGW